jgi:hypothetical protein
MKYIVRVCPDLNWQAQILNRHYRGNQMSNDLEALFDGTMMDVYRRALSDCDYKATRFLQMLHEHRGLATARILLHASKVSEGYIALWERKRLDLTVEAVVLAPEWHSLFSEEERDIARKRLAEYGYEVFRDSKE